jgi:hypothetical protein
MHHSLMRIWIRISLFTLMRIRILGKVMCNCDHWSTDPQRLCMSLHVSIGSALVPVWRHFESLQLLKILISMRICIQLSTVMRILIQFPRIMLEWIFVATLLKPRSWKAKLYIFYIHCTIPTICCSAGLVCRLCCTTGLASEPVSLQAALLAGEYRFIPWQS